MVSLPAARQTRPDGERTEVWAEKAAEALFYNTSLFKKAGVQRPADDWTKDDFYNIAKKIGATGGGAVAWDWVVRLWGS